MENQKIENLLNLALNATPEEREKSLNLDVGYEPENNTWEVIVKYAGDTDDFERQLTQILENGMEEGQNPIDTSNGMLQERLQTLIGGYLILEVTEEQLNKIASLEQVIFIEKPKRLFFEVINGTRVSCVDSVRREPFELTGQGTITAFLDSGIDYRNDEFRNSDGTTRILEIWDQVNEKVYTREELNQRIGIQNRSEQRESIVGTDHRDASGHGTAVAGIAAGNTGVANESELLVVKLGTPKVDGFPRTTELMTGIDYCIRKGIEYGRPLSVNISIGNTYGSHNGTSLIERYLTDISNQWKCVICVGSGNEGNTAGHKSGKLIMGTTEEIQLAVQELETAFSLQIWKSYEDQVDVTIVSPGGMTAGPIQEQLGPQKFVLDGTELLLYYGEPSPYSSNQEIYIEFLPAQTYVTAGVWRIVLNPGRIVAGDYDLWLPSAGVLNEGTDFFLPTQENTLTIPSTAEGVITVGAYNALTYTYADFSGRGERLADAEGTVWRQKPDLIAPGVNVQAVAVGGGNITVSGTSFATPFVTGGASLLMEWGIVRGNDPYLYGEKLRTYLNRGARQLPGYERVNSLTGWGALCVKDSIPRMV